jgi:primary-amine oxidase
MGTATRALIVGYDCPYDALYLPGITHTSIGTLLQQDAICVFERDSGKPLSRHTGYMKGEMGVSAAWYLSFLRTYLATRMSSHLGDQRL